jgi:DNA-binding transcriptional ArsR family regulator
VVDLAAAHPISRPAVSRHLRVLTQAGLVVATDRGRERHYRLQREPLAEVARLIADLEAPQTRALPGSGVLDALETEVRRTSRERRRGAPPPSRATDHEETA